MAAPPDRFLPSLLERLTCDAEDPLFQNDRAWKTTLLTEIEQLLNTKRAFDEVPDSYRYTSRALPNYGLPDYTSMSVKDLANQDRLRAAIEAALRDFEPRLTSVNVTLEKPRDTEPALRFTIEAFARREPRNEPIRFETVLKTDSSTFVVRKDKDE